jgi:hypothetical protein
MDLISEFRLVELSHLLRHQVEKNVSARKTLLRVIDA